MNVAHLLGKKARYWGHSIRVNPYNVGTANYTAWRNGWRGRKVREGYSDVRLLSRSGVPISCAGSATGPALEGGPSNRPHWSDVLEGERVLLPSDATQAA